LNVNTNIPIYDREMWTDLHVWSVGPWSEARGGVAYEQRYAYLYAWFGTDEGEGKDKPSEWWLQRASICNGWVGQAHGYAENGGCAGKLVLTTRAFLRYEGLDGRLQGVFVRIPGLKFTRVARQSRGLPAPNGRWAHEVWLNEDGIAIYDHEMWTDLHVWSVGPWSKKSGGVAYEQRYAYIYAWFGEDEGEGRDKPSEWWLQQAKICSGWVGQAHGYAANGGCAGKLVLTTEKQMMEIKEAEEERKKQITQAGEPGPEAGCHVTSSCQLGALKTLFMGQHGLTNEDT
jgi:hypothetical protein